MFLVGMSVMLGFVVIGVTIATITRRMDKRAHMTRILTDVPVSVGEYVIVQKKTGTILGHNASYTLAMDEARKSVSNRIDYYNVTAWYINHEQALGLVYEGTLS